MGIVFTFFSSKYWDNKESKINLNFSFPLNVSLYLFLLVSKVRYLLNTFAPSYRVTQRKSSGVGQVACDFSLGTGHGWEGKFDCEDGFGSWKAKKIRSEILEQNKRCKNSVHHKPRKFSANRLNKLEKHRTGITNHVMIARCQSVKGLGRTVPF